MCALGRETGGANSARVPMGCPRVSVFYRCKDVERASGRHCQAARRGGIGEGARLTLRSTGFLTRKDRDAGGARGRTRERARRGQGPRGPRARAAVAKAGGERGAEGP